MKAKKVLYDMARTISFDDRMNYEAEIRDVKLPLIQNYLYEIKQVFVMITGGGKNKLLVDMVYNTILLYNNTKKE